MKIIDNVKYYKISEIVEETKINKSTIHYYKDLGLIPNPLVINKNMIYYKEITINCLNLIRYLKENMGYSIETISNLFKEYKINFENKNELILSVIEMINDDIEKIEIEKTNDLKECIELTLLKDKKRYNTKEIEILNIYKELKKYDINNRLIKAYIEQGIILSKIEKEISDEVLNNTGNIPEILILDILTKLKTFVLNKQILKTFKGE